MKHKVRSFIPNMSLDVLNIGESSTEGDIRTNN